MRFALNQEAGNTMDGSSKETGPKTRKINGHLTVRLSLVFYLSFSTFRFLSIALSLSGFNSDWKPSKN